MSQIPVTKLNLRDQQSSSGLCATELGWNLVDLQNVTMGNKVAHVQRRAGQVCMQEASRVAVARAHRVHNGHALRRGGACRPAACTGYAAGCATADHCDLSRQGGSVPKLSAVHSLPLPEPTIGASTAAKHQAASRRAKPAWIARMWAGNDSVYHGQHAPDRSAAETPERHPRRFPSCCQGPHPQPATRKSKASPRCRATPQGSQHCGTQLGAACAFCA